MKYFYKKNPIKLYIVKIPTKIINKIIKKNTKFLYIAKKSPMCLFRCFSQCFLDISFNVDAAALE